MDTRNKFQWYGFLVFIGLLTFWSVRADDSDDLPTGPSGGELVVYSATVRSLAAATSTFDWEENRNPHTNYSIYHPDGTLVRNVVNSFGPYDERAKVVNLPEGKYVVRAMSPRDGRIDVPVVVRPGHRTIVKLAESVDSPRKQVPGSQAIRSAHGNVVGWWFAGN
jgi:hypothetical protein